MQSNQTTHQEWKKEQSWKEEEHWDNSNKSSSINDENNKSTMEKMKDTVASGVEMVKDKMNDMVEKVRDLTVSSDSEPNSNENIHQQPKFSVHPDASPIPPNKENKNNDMKSDFQEKKEDLKSDIKEKKEQFSAEFQEKKDEWKSDMQEKKNDFSSGNSGFLGVNDKHGSNFGGGKVDSGFLGVNDKDGSGFQGNQDSSFNKPGFHEKIGSQFEENKGLHSGFQENQHSGLIHQDKPGVTPSNYDNLYLPPSSQDNLPPSGMDKKSDESGLNSSFFPPHGENITKEWNSQGQEHINKGGENMSDQMWKSDKGDQQPQQWNESPEKCLQPGGIQEFAPIQNKVSDHTATTAMKSEIHAAGGVEKKHI